MLNPPACSQTVLIHVQGTDTSPHFTYGLHKRCSSVTGRCDSFPKYADCQRDPEFCSMWRSVGFLMSFAVLLELATLVAYLIVILGGQQLRQYGWKVIVSLLAAVVVVQCSGMAIIVRSILFATIPSRADMTRLTSSITTSASSQAGNSTPPGSSAQYPGHWL
jgi:hypothetical protein